MMQQESICKCCQLTICDIIDRLVPAGTIHYHAGATAPKGYLACDGSEISRAEYKNLFAAIRTIYGNGDGETTFNLPDLRGEFIRCLDSGKGVDPERQVGSWQKGSLVAMDATKSTVSVHALYNITDNNTANFLEYAGLDSIVLSDYAGAGTAFLTAPNTSIASQISTASSRPRNVALLPCIKY